MADRPDEKPDAVERVERPQPPERVEPEAPRNGTLGSLIEAGGRAAAPVARVGVRGARGVARRLGVDRAIGRAVDRGMDRALQSDAAERAVERALQSDSVKRAWDKVLESEEAQKLVERVAEAPEVRSAITSQATGLLEDVRRSARSGARKLDDVLDRVGRRLTRRPQRLERPIYAGGATRLLAVAMDAGLLAGILLAISTVLALLLDTLFSLGGDAGAVTIAFGLFAWLIAAALYLGLFWALAERTPGMTFFGLRIVTEAGATVGPRQDLRRLLGFYLSALPLLLGFKGIVFEERRRGWHDRFAGTVVVYADPEIDPGVDQAGHVSLPRES
jgi:uncharacterized RDD family membrane protein YckC